MSHSIVEGNSKVKWNRLEEGVRTPGYDRSIMFRKIHDERVNITVRESTSLYLSQHRCT